MLYSESIAGRGIAILISWLGTAGPVDCFNREFEEYSDLQFYAPKTRYITNLYSHDYACHVLTSAYYPLSIIKQISLKLPKII